MRCHCYSHCGICEGDCFVLSLRRRFCVCESSHSLMARGYVVFSVAPLDIPCVAQGLCLGGVALEGVPSLFCCLRSCLLCITSM